MKQFNLLFYIKKNENFKAYFEEKILNFEFCLKLQISEICYIFMTNVGLPGFKVKGLDIWD